ncbi:MAG: TIGR04282 family arsenosugar biosynthesis glycosyltransferase [Hyphomicrobiaceae bacterium]|nr:TIGR04282 family arsenosugar biosynthesis glycosyltransferase [Hyphomicrobiaceae bacterium]
MGARAVTPRWRPRLVMMVRLPAMGRVKTRLARGVGAVAAAAFYRRSTSGLVARLGTDPRWQLTLAVTPDRSAASGFWTHQIPRVGQGRGDLGQRMQRLFDRLPPGPVVIIGSDSPSIRPAHISRAFRALGNADAVLGPAPDGGYWLVGLKRFPNVPRAFAGVRWSSATTLADTIAALGPGHRLALIDTLDDIDEPADLTRDRGRHARRI